MLHSGPFAVIADATRARADARAGHGCCLIVCLYFIVGRYCYYLSQSEPSCG